MTGKIIISCLIVFLFSALMTWVIRQYSIRKAILDIPNERSSHSIPTPRGGGLAIVLTFFLSILLLGITHTISASLAWALNGGGLVIAAIGYADDVYSLKARTRIIMHFLVAVWAVYWLGGMPAIDFGTGKILLHGMGSLLAITAIVWCINFYNFMDGIDGLAGSEGIFVALTSGLVLWFLGAQNLATVMWLLSAAITGFIVWNWPPAKIFLGDAGSGFLGYTFAVLALFTINENLLPITFWWVLLAVFLYDATFTLISRITQGKKWYSAHREHAYQHLIALGMNHKKVTTSIVFFNVCVLLPIACGILFWPTQTVWILLAITMGVFLAWKGIKSISVSI